MGSQWLRLRLIALFMWLAIMGFPRYHRWRQMRALQHALFKPILQWVNRSTASCLILYLNEIEKFKQRQEKTHKWTSNTDNKFHYEANSWVLHDHMLLQNWSNKINICWTDNTLERKWNAIIIYTTVVPDTETKVFRWTLPVLYTNKAANR